MLTKTTKGEANKANGVLMTSAFISKPQKTTTWAISFTINFPSKEEADDFLEDRNLLKEPMVVASFAKAAEESQQGKARPMEELYKKYGV